MCPACKRHDCKEEIKEKCKCDTETRSELCMRRHTETFCPQNTKCQKCDGFTRKGKPHVCTDEKYCNFCKKVVDMDHLCYIMTAEEANKKVKAFAGFVFFDFECYENPDTGNHVVNLAMAIKVCSKCLDTEDKCESCSRKYTFYSIEQFVDFMLEPENENFQFFAHNSRGYDTHFIVHELMRRRTPRDTVPKLILNGSKIQGLYYRKICVKDSSSFLPMKLADFPKAFGLTELKKGNLK
jgi:hypothetical protein